MAATVLGTEKAKLLWTCRGILARREARRFARHFIRRAGMTPARQGRIDPYPYRGGGGLGWTGWFPLMESYLIIDVYTDLGETEVLLSTCEPGRLDRWALLAFLGESIGPATLREL